VSRLRSQRIADRIHEELSEMLIRQVRDPRLEGVTITGVRVDRELTFADIYISAIEGSQRADAVISGFEHAGGFLRSELARKVELRTFPRLRFHWDPTLEKAEQIEKLLASLKHETSAEGDEISTQQDGKGEIDE
jgi:ribosome-binding factor A